MSNLTNASSSIPGLLWSYYIDNLWNYNSGSAVARIGKSLSLPLVLILPILILTLLDISSYVIARTLGVIDDVKASTSDKKTVHAVHDPPSIIINSPKPDQVITPLNTAQSDGSTRLSVTPEPARSPDALPLEYFTSEENNFKLSGFDVFSPAPSQPPSPTISRQQLPADFLMTSVNEHSEDGIHIKRRKRRESK
ncbi:hypothetical protein PQX77_003710 [Marasmius sp. AFHP31]|nr:hypothetical protein PQX77_003710 [Marasmius sp. AFHP31]